MFSRFSSSENLSPKRAIAVRRFEAARLMKKHTEQVRHLNAGRLEKKKRMPLIVNKLCPNPENPNEDSFAMTLDVSPPIMPISRPITNKIPPADDDDCLGARSTLLINFEDMTEALAFYKAAFGAEVRRDSDFEDTLIKIGSETCVVIGTHLTP